MKTTHYVAADPGHSGAIALLNAAGTYGQVWPMPTHKRGTVIELDLPALADILKPMKRLPQVVAGLEWPSTWPGTFGNVARDATAFGKGLGTLDTYFYLLGFNHHRITPQKWKARLGLPGKTHDPKSLQGVILWDKTYPALSGLIRGPRGGVLDGPLDALLLCHFLRLGGESPVGHKGGRRPPTYRGLGYSDEPAAQLGEWWDGLTVEHK